MDTQTLIVRRDVHGATAERMRYGDTVPVWQETNTALVVKVPGRSYWKGIGLERGYSGAEFVVYAVVDGEVKDGGLWKRLTVEQVAAFPVTKRGAK